MKDSSKSRDIRKLQIERVASDLQVTLAELLETGAKAKESAAQIAKLLGRPVPQTEPHAEMARLELGVECEAFGAAASRLATAAHALDFARRKAADLASAISREQLGRR